MADLLIRGMELPENRYRTVEITFDQDGNPMALADGGDAYAVIPVPDHGRLIDADAIAAYIEKQISEKDEIMKLCKRVGDIENYFSLSKIQTGMVSCRRVLDNAPTIIPASKEGGA